MKITSDNFKINDKKNEENIKRGDDIKNYDDQEWRCIKNEGDLKNKENVKWKTVVRASASNIR